MKQTTNATSKIVLTVAGAPGWRSPAASSTPPERRRQPIPRPTVHRCFAARRRLRDQRTPTTTPGAQRPTSRKDDTVYRNHPYLVAASISDRHEELRRAAGHARLLR